MRTFSCYIHDDRYAAPSLVFHMTETEDQVRELARRDLADNPHHLAIEVCEADRVLFTQRRDPAAAA